MKMVCSGAFRLCVVVGLALILSTAVTAQKPRTVTNDQLIQLAKAGFDEEGLIHMVESPDAALDLTVEGLLALKEGGVSQKVINAALAAKNRKDRYAANLANTRSATPELEVGVYLTVNDKQTLLEPELVNFRTGWAKLNGAIKGQHSPIQLAGKVTVLIRCPEGVSGAEYQLLKLDEKEDRREFRAMSSGWSHASTGADKNAVPIKFEKTGPRTYTALVADLGKGEYAFLPPGAAVSASAANGGKAYTFGIKE